jgi:MGT family glycosyltransferase
MKIAWFCIPAHGHTNPTLAVVKELVEAGHEIFYFSFKNFKEKIENTGASYISCDEYDFDMEDKDNGEKVAKDIAFATELLVNSTLALDEMIANKIKEIEPDLIVSDSVSYWGKLTAIKYNIPYVSSTTTFAFYKYSSAYMNHGFC